MSTTKTTIANLALLRIGVTQFLTDVDSQASSDNNAAAIAAAWDFEREKLLREIPWPFARKYAALELNDGSEETPVNRDWIYEYGFPDDALFVRRLVTCKGQQNCSPPPYVRGRNDGGDRVIYTNLTEAWAEYTVNVTDPGEFDEAFASLFAWRIGRVLALGVARLPAMADVCDKEYEKEKAEAASVAFQEAEYAIASGEADPRWRELFNLALTRIGIARNVIMADKELTFAKLWPRVCAHDERDFILRDAPWPWATKYSTPALVAGSPTDPVNSDWRYAFLYPADCLFVRRIVTPAGRKEVRPWKFRIGSGITNPDAEEDDQVRGRLIYTNDVRINADGDPEIEIEYTLAVDDINEFDPMFFSMVAWRVAALLAPSISQTKSDPQIAARCFANYEMERSRALRAALNEQEAEDAPDAEWIRERG